MKVKILSIRVDGGAEPDFVYQITEKPPEEMMFYPAITVPIYCRYIQEDYDFDHNPVYRCVDWDATHYVDVRASFVKAVQRTAELEP